MKRVLITWNLSDSPPVSGPIGSTFWHMPHQEIFTRDADVTLAGIEGTALYVEGLDAINGNPVLKNMSFLKDVFVIVTGINITLIYAEI
ncbi:MAG: hypothetical protein JRI48_06180 [Deltaproteobacteria bacterium]|nr:hypothetical protein [Deltaproteobacteria bacterium]